MLEFAITIKSDWIFKEAATHLAGRSNRYFLQVLGRVAALGLEESMRELRKMVLERLKEAELRMFRVSANASESSVAHAAVNFFRQWLAEQLQANQGSGMGPGQYNPRPVQSRNVHGPTIHIPKMCSNVRHARHADAGCLSC